jgi:hypothetical protein
MSRSTTRETVTSCGAELAASAEVPAQLAHLFTLVACNLETHAAWVGQASEAAALEHAGLLRVAQHYRSLVEAAEGAACAMRELASLPVAEHDLRAFDQEAFARFMQQKVAAQRRLADLLLEHAAESTARLDETLGTK